MTEGRCRIVGVVLASASLCVGQPVASGQNPPEPPTFASAVDLITVDAVVLDEQGRPVPGLTQADFVVTEDGRPREIASFEAFVAQEPAAKPLPSVVASNLPGPPSAGRAFAIVLDDWRIAPGRTEAARHAVVSFLEGSVRDGDEVILASTSGDLWWNARIPEGREDLLAVLSRLQGRDVVAPSLDAMSDYEAFRINNYEESPAMAGGLPQGPGAALPARAGETGVGAPPPGALGSVKERVKKRWEQRYLCVPTNCDGMVRARAAEIDHFRRGRMGDTLGAVRRGLGALALVHGRKSLLLLSEGFLQDSGTQLRQVAAASRESNTAIYFLDVRGLLALPGGGSAMDAGPPPDLRDQAAMNLEETTLASAGAQTLADDTGGFSVRNANDLAAAVQRIADESRVFYLLGFYPPDGKATREWRKLHVEVKRPGLAVRARRGYTLAAATEPAPDRRARNAEAKAGPAPAVLRALDSPHDVSAIPLRAMAYVFEPRDRGTTHVVVAVELDAGRVAFQPKGGSRVARLEVSVVAANRDSGRGFRHDDSFDLVLKGGEAPGWRSLAREFELPTGITQVRVVVRDPARGTLGSVSHRFEVPPANVLHLSTPILTDRAVAAREGESHPRPALAAARAFHPSGPLYCQFEVFGAARGPGAAAPRVLAGLELWTVEGRLARKAEPTPIAVSDDGRLVRLVAIAAEGLKDGDYDLVLDIRDEVGGARLKQRESFQITKTSRGPALARGSEPGPATRGVDLRPAGAGGSR